MTIAQACEMMLVEDYTAGRIRGQVTAQEMNAPISGAQIRVSATLSDPVDAIPAPFYADSALTDETGHYELGWMEIGFVSGELAIEIEASKDNYRATDTTTTISVRGLKKDNDVEIDIALARSP